MAEGYPTGLAEVEGAVLEPLPRGETWRTTTNNPFAPGHRGHLLRSLTKRKRRARNLPAAF